MLWSFRVSRWRFGGLVARGPVSVCSVGVSGVMGLLVGLWNLKTESCVRLECQCQAGTSHSRPRSRVASPHLLLFGRAANLKDRRAISPYVLPDVINQCQCQRPFSFPLLMSFSRRAFSDLCMYMYSGCQLEVWDMKC